jgi:hypothetical protein
MRFSAAIHLPPPLRKPAAPDILRRLAANEPAPRRPAEPASTDDLPADLDQRVRLVGEW